jgi:hypothetical protein
MKVITQLVRHFWQRGALTVEEIDYLVRHGFVRARDLPGYQPGTEDEPGDRPSLFFDTPVQPHPLDVVQESLGDRQPGRRRGRAKPRGKVLEPADLCRRVTRELDRRAEALQSLIPLARRIEPCGDWESAANVLRRVKSKRFTGELAAAFRNRSATLRQLWRAVDLEPFYRLLRETEYRGRAANAYWAMLVAPDFAALGKYAWVLKHGEMQSVSHLRVVHRHLLAGLNGLYLDERRLLTRALVAGCDPVPFWALVLLHNARRPKSDTPPHPAREYDLTEQPDDRTWRQAWTGALGMDRRKVTKLLADCYRDETERQARPVALIDRPLFCPVGWHVPDEE